MEGNCLSLLDTWGIPYEGLTHEPAFTIELCKEIENQLGCKIAKNLFLCNAQKTAFYLVIMPGDKVFKTKFLSKQINSSRLSFADAEHMEKYLGVTPGSVSVLGLMNDKEKAVKFVIDKDLLDDEYIGFHPCLNTSTLKLKFSDILDTFLPHLGVTPLYVDLPTEQ